MRDTVELSDSARSQQVTTLEQAGYVKVTKGQVGRRPPHLAVGHAFRSSRVQRPPHLAVLNELAASPAAAPGSGDTSADSRGSEPA